MNHSPHNTYSQITENLFTGGAPSLKDYTELKSLGVTLVINMRFERRPKRDAAIPTLWLPAIDTPFTPIPIAWLVRGATAALKEIKQGGAIYAHCAHGIHRGPAMACAILISQGRSLVEAVELVRKKRPVAAPQDPYILRQIAGFEQRWQAQRLPSG